MPWSRRSWTLVGIISAASVVCLLAFHPASHADPGRLAPVAMAPADAPRPTWQPSVVTAPGLPLQCADGTWTRTVVRGGCARHGGVAY